MEQTFGIDSSMWSTERRGNRQVRVGPMVYICGSAEEAVNKEAELSSEGYCTRSSEGDVPGLFAVMA